MLIITPQKSLDWHQTGLTHPSCLFCKLHCHLFAKIQNKPRDMQSSETRGDALSGLSPHILKWKQQHLCVSWTNMRASNKLIAHIVCYWLLRPGLRAVGRQSLPVCLTDCEKTSELSCLFDICTLWMSTLLLSTDKLTHCVWTSNR